MKAGIVCGATCGLASTAINWLFLHLEFMSPEWWAFSVIFAVVWAFLFVDRFERYFGEAKG